MTRTHESTILNDLDPSSSHLQIQALGRPAILGQLYNARTHTLLPSSLRLFSTDDETTMTSRPTPSMNVDVRQVRSLSDRARSLSLSGSISLSLLGGLIPCLGGLGAYLNSQSNHVQSSTVAAIGRFRTITSSVRLDLDGGWDGRRMGAEGVRRTGATHVVVEITYGGNIVASVTQAQDVSRSEGDIHGGLDVGSIGGRTAAIGVKVQGERTRHEGDEHTGMEMSLAADFVIDEQDEVPMSVEGMTALVKKSRQLVGSGVPCELGLLPLSWFDLSVPTCRELSEADLIQLTDLYDRIVSLGKNQSWLAQTVEEYANLFPSFLESCRQKSIKVNHLVQHARDELRAYLERARSEQDASIPTPLELHARTEAQFMSEMDDFERDRTRWVDMLTRIRTAEDHGFPASSIAQVKSNISRDHHLIVLVVVPEEVNWTDLVETYRVHAQDVRRWSLTLGDRVENDDDDARTLVPTHTAQTEHATLFADHRLDRDLLQLDDQSGNVARALTTARNEHKPVLLTYGFSRDGLSTTLEWKVLGQEGWGILVDRRDKWRYVGDIQHGRPHGRGVMTYVDGSEYTGDWVRGKREGRGKTVSSTMTVEGVYVDDRVEPDGVVLNATVYRDQTPVECGHVALRRYSSTQEHVQRIASVFGWQTGRRFTVVLESVGNKRVQVRVNGGYLDPSEGPHVAFQPWPLDGDGEKTLRVYQS